MWQKHLIWLIMLAILSLINLQAQIFPSNSHTTSIRVLKECSVDLFESIIRLCRIGVGHDHLAALTYTHVKTSVARWSGPISTDECDENAPFTVILAIINVVGGFNKS